MKMKYMMMKMMGRAIESDSTDGEDEQECVTVGDVVWGKHGRIWYPAQVCSIDEVPNDIYNKLGKKTEGKVIVKWWDENNYSMLPGNKVELLARNKIDEFRANRSSQIAKAYHSALADMIN